jgi:general secretion pathway protein G
MTNHRTHRRIVRAARRGFTLLEIIVVVTIIALLATLVAPKLLQNIWKSKQKVAQAEVASIAQQLGIYLADNGMSRPPEDLELSVLTSGPDPQLDPDDLIDPWGRPYILVVPGEHNSTFDIISYGGNGEPGGEGEDADVWN